MRRLTEILFAAALLFIQPLAAQTTAVGQAVVLPLASEVDAGTMARVVTDRGRPAECLAPLAVTRIDGEASTVSAQGFLIEPGVHSLNGRAMLDLSYCPLSDPRFTIGATPDLEVEFEAGSTYYIGYYYPPDRPGDWKLVVWNIETSPIVEPIEQRVLQQEDQ